MSGTDLLLVVVPSAPAGLAAVPDRHDAGLIWRTCHRSPSPPIRAGRSSLEGRSSKMEGEIRPDPVLITQLAGTRQSLSLTLAVQVLPGCHRREQIP